jgi:hypothetical protein
VPSASVHWEQLEPQTRVYFRDGQSAWRYGRIDDHIDHDCFIALPNKKQARLPVAQVYVRWHKRIGDPVEHLAAMVTETPFFHSARAELVAGFVRRPVA